MYEYKKTGRADTDKCIELANKAHNYYFDDPLQNKLEFAKTAKEFFNAIEYKFIKRTSEDNIDKALKKFFNKNLGKYAYISTELYAIKDRLNIIIKNPSLVDEKTKFVLDHTARFIEAILPYACSVEIEVEHHKKFTSILYEESQKEFKFFEHIVYDSKTGSYVLYSDTVKNRYLQAFYDNGWRAQKELNGLSFIKQFLNMDNPKIEQFYINYAGRDNFSSLTFARMANEQFMKYLSEQHTEFWNYLENCLPKKLSDDAKNKIISSRINDNKDISLPARISALGMAGILNELIVREAILVNSRGNNIVHHGYPIEYSSCYHNLELLNYLNKYCK